MNLSQKIWRFNLQHQGNTLAIAEQRGEAEDYPQVKRWNNWIDRENTTPSRQKWYG